MGQVDIQEAWTRVTGGECLYHMPTTIIFGYCVFDQVIDLADEAATGLIEAEMANYLNGTGANYTVVSADVSEASWFEGDYFQYSYISIVFSPRHMCYRDFEVRVEDLSLIHI